MNFPIDADTEISELERSGIDIDNETYESLRWVLDLIKKSYEVGLTEGPDNAYYPISVEKEIKKARKRFAGTLAENITRRILELQNKAYFAGCERREQS